MSTRWSRAVVILAVAALLAGAVAPAHAVLERVGPVTPGHGYPQWYQDGTGLSLEFCTPLNAAELDGGWCVLFTGDTTAPEVFPTSFADEHFYYVADAGDRQVASPRGGTLLVFLRLAVEGAFANAGVVSGDQIVFSRLRIRIAPLPFDGTYTVYTPAGTFVFPDQLASDPRGIFFTEDIGINCPPGGPFDCALAGSLGPFLLPSAVPGGAEMPALTAANPAPDPDPAHFGGSIPPVTAYPGTGKAYLGDPARLGPVTGSPLPPFVVADGTTRNANVFRVEGPNGFVYETFDFSVAGRVFADAMPGRVSVDRASYARNAAGQKLDVFATGFETTQGRLPAQPRPPVVTPQLSFFDAPCSSAGVDALGDPIPPFGAPAVAATETQMFATGSHFFGQARPVAIPDAVCVKDAAARDVNGNVAPVHFPTIVTDEVTVTQALHDPTARTLTITARSSDETVTPMLRVPFPGTVELPSPATWTLSDVAAAPANVRVLSSASGTGQSPVVTAFGTGAPAGVPVAVNDSATVVEDTPVTIAVLANDTAVAGGTVTLVAAPRLGSATVNPDGTITYQPGLDATGNDSLTYRVTVGPAVSNVANVAITISPVNDPPTAVSDRVSTIVNVPTAIAVVANDTDPDAGDTLGAVVNPGSLTPATGASITSVTGGTVNFTATVAGTYTFTYRARDAAGLLSATSATVTVTVVPAETVAIARAQFTASGGRLRVDGTISPAAGQPLRLDVLSGGVVVRTDTVPSDGAGLFTLDLRGVTLPSGALTVRATSSNGTVATAAVVRR